MARNGFLYRNSLGLVLIALMLASLTAQIYTGWRTENKELAEEGQHMLSVGEYLQSGHFVQATFENWESEFLQMMLYVLLTVSLRQKGSSESNKLYGDQAVGSVSTPHPDAQWPVRNGGLWLTIYLHSLSLAFGVLFVISFILHFRGSYYACYLEPAVKHKPHVTARAYIYDTRF